MSQASVDVEAVRTYLEHLQASIVSGLEEIDGGRFQHSTWRKAPGEPLQGNGRTCILEEGRIFERAGIGFSHVQGDRLPPTASAAHPEVAGCGFHAIGVSLVLHPRNPFVPTVHMNVRLFQASPNQDGSGTGAWWFGGGMDLTPYYGFEDDARHFHATCRAALAPFGAEYYPRFKTWCDEYFFLKHRNEARGIGGIFFDDFNELGPVRSFDLLRSVGDHFLAAYEPIVQRRRSLPYGDNERHFQALRRGRYVEFNLVHDRGTLFGLQSGGRTESILMSMPPVVRWAYEWTPPEGSPEARLTRVFLPARDWLAGTDPA